jgi:ParB-like chromosome segregation protein Spo0J
MQKRLHDIEVHPVADLFPMMGDDELRELAADIKEHGLVHPIYLNGGGQLLDGRNRLRACEIADIKPVFETVDPPDVLAFVVSLNVKRRNLSAGAKAIAAAEAWDRATFPKNLGKQGKAGALAALFGINHTYVQQARALLQDDPPAAEAVKAGGVLKDAYEKLQRRKGDLLNHEIKLRDLNATRPDLTARVDAGTLDLDEAIRIAASEAAERKQQRADATANLIDGVRGLDRPPEQAAEMAEVYDFALAESMRELIDARRLRNVAAYALALAEALEGGDQ